MKKSLIFVASLALFLGSCSDEKPLSSNDESSQAALHFSVSAVENFSPGSGTRAVISSAEAIQSVADIRIHAFALTEDEEDFTWVRSYDISPDWAVGGTSATHSVGRSEMLPTGRYRFLAVGMDTAGDYDLGTFTDRTKYSEVVATLGAAEPEDAQELFSGYTDATVTDKVTAVSINMVRRVAGVLLYVENIPTHIGENPVYYMRLHLANSNTQVDVTTHADLHSAEIPLVAARPGYDIFYVEVWRQGDEDGDGYYDGSTAQEGVSKLPKTTLAGAYVLPGNHNAGNTMVLSLLGRGDDDRSREVLKSWAVMNKDVEERYEAFYNIFPNYLYTIGQKRLSAGTEGDKPIDLSNIQALSVGIDGRWLNIDEMELE